MIPIRCLLGWVLMGWMAAHGAVVTAHFTAAATVPVTAAGYTAAGNTVDLSLGFAPATGTDLTVVNNTGADFIAGRFANLAHGQPVTLVYQNVRYQYVANYHGGTGNDLVLQWAMTKIYGWGHNGSGRLGNNSTLNSPVPVAVNSSVVLAGRTVIAAVAGASHSLALCADGTLAAWGSNASGQLGTGNTTDSAVPVAVNTGGVLAGRTVVAIAAGASHSLALCSDGRLVAWGANSNGQLGDGTSTSSVVPVAVYTGGTLAGKTVTSMVAGDQHGLALCADGTVVGWGQNSSGQLGNGTNNASAVPVTITEEGLLACKQVVALAAGSVRSLALATDGTVAAWGNGILGNGLLSASNVPVWVNTGGALSNKEVAAIAAGGIHHLVQCADGMLVSWGNNSYGQLGQSLSQTLPEVVTVTEP